MQFKNCQKWPQYKGYSQCKIPSFGQKLYFPKTCVKRFYKHIQVVPRKKSLEKTANTKKKEHFETCQKWPQ